MTVAQMEAGAKTNEPHLLPSAAGAAGPGRPVVTFDALHSVKANISKLAEAKIEVGADMAYRSRSS